MMDYFSTIINGGKVVSVNRKLVAASLCNSSDYVKSLGVDVLKYAKKVYVVINNSEDITLGMVKYHVAHICVDESIGMENVYHIRDAIDDDEYNRETIFRKANISCETSHAGTTYSINMEDN